jgi:hypothetical protein
MRRESESWSRVKSGKRPYEPRSRRWPQITATATALAADERRAPAGAGATQIAPSACQASDPPRAGTNRRATARATAFGNTIGTLLREGIVFQLSNVPRCFKKLFAVLFVRARCVRDRGCTRRNLRPARAARGSAFICGCSCSSSGLVALAPGRPNPSAVVLRPSAASAPSAANGSIASLGRVDRDAGGDGVRGQVDYVNGRVVRMRCGVGRRRIRRRVGRRKRVRKRRGHVNAPGGRLRACEAQLRASRRIGRANRLQTAHVWLNYLD